MEMDQHHELNEQDLPLESDIQENREIKKKINKLKLKQTKYGYIIPLQVMGIALMALDLQILSMGMPALMKDFNIEQSKAQWATTFSSLGVTTFSIPLSNVAKRYGLVPCLIIYHAISMALFIALYFVNNFWVLCGLRFFTGMCQVGCSSNRNALCRLLSYPEKQQNNLLYNKIVLSVIQTVIPLLIGAIIDHGNYRIVYLIIVGVDALQIIYIAFCESPLKRKTGNFDFLGIICLFITMISIAFCFNMIGYQKYVGASIFAALTIIFLILLIIIEKRVKDPVIPYKLLRQPTLDYLIANVFIVNSAAIFQYLMPLIFDYYGKTSQQYSYVVTVNGIVGFIVSLFMPVVSRKFLIKHIILTFGLVGIIFSSPLPFVTKQLTTIAIVYVCYMGLTQPRNQLMLPAFQLSADQSQAIQLAPLPQTFGNIAKTVMIPLLTAILQLCQKGDEITDQEYQLSLSIQFSIVIVWNIVFEVIIFLRTGQLPNEKGKKQWRQEKVIFNNVYDETSKQNNEKIELQTQINDLNKQQSQEEKLIIQQKEINKQDIQTIKNEDIQEQ